MVTVKLRPDQVRTITLLLEEQAQQCRICATNLEELIATLAGAKPAPVEAPVEAKPKVGRPKAAPKPAPRLSPARTTPNWSEAEDNILLGYRNVSPVPWDEVAARLPGRTGDAAKSRLTRLVERAAMAGEEPVPTPTVAEPEPTPEPVAAESEPVEMPEPEPEPIAPTSQSDTALVPRFVSPMNQQATTMPAGPVRPPLLSELMKGR